MPKIPVQTIEAETITEAWTILENSKLPLIFTQFIGHKELNKNKNLIIKAQHALVDDLQYIFLLQTPGFPCIIKNKE